MFVDEVEIRVASGAGGRGCIAFRREKYVPRGGPSGGDGGNGGSVFLTASPHLNTLVSFRFHPDFRAERGQHGLGSNMHGRRGKHLVIKVPIGTVVYELPESGGEPLQIADLIESGARVRVAAGGQGGRGNARFASATNRAPRRADPGMPGEEKRLRLQLKLLADVGLVGFPNAGKSTLISAISAAKPKIADYPFTTLTPHLGVVALDDDRSFVVADVPGLIEGAHRGLGLGHQFLQHLERTRVLVHVVDVSGASGRDVVEDFDTIRRELRLYRPELADKPAIAAANKMDAAADAGEADRLDAHVAPLGIPIHRISAVTGRGVAALVEDMWRHLQGSVPDA
ncbi:MAG TPA: GTPase ObgE [Vicinamibacterales bacterium]|nr:GTPase ObgE [Vicinamibacterales bacterium]HOQ61468.1 GTPase ObgE [Vicinamibacterales bacterium]HPK71944.1 GTPase ObgE [Vicinamibacterales bacterium]HPW19851.1 GTPase ObgE [Vicinamibacterales bacterium]